MGKPLGSGKTRCSVGPCRAVAIAICAIPLSLLPVVAGAVETDRITVEDPGTGAIKFKVTSDGNVTAARYVGDGAGLSNVAHWKGTWSSATAYAKDDCVLYGGSSYIALQQSTNAQPNLTPASWTVMAQQGATGPTGPQGQQGTIGPQGPAGSSDTQAQILAKLANQADGTLLLMKQGPVEANTATKFQVLDNAGNSTYGVDSKGNMGLLNPGGPSQFTQTTYAGTSATQRAVFAGNRARGTASAPAAVQPNDKLGTFSFGGYDGSAFQAGSLLEVFVDGAVTTGSVPQRFSIVTGSSAANRAERLVVKSDGNVGIGTASPTQKLEIVGPVKATAFIGDGSQLTNLPSGPVGPQGPEGPTGATGEAGPIGPQGPAGSPDSQAQILAKISGQADGTLLLMKQGPVEASTANKFQVLDNAGNSTYGVDSKGNMALLNPAGSSQFTQTTYAGTSATQRAVFAGNRARGTASAPAAVQPNDKLGTFSFGGYDGSAFQAGSLLEVFVDGAVTPGSVPQRFSIVTGSSLTNRAERLVVKSDGNVGIGTMTPTQKLEVKDGGFRIDTASTITKPGCDTTTRGTFWLSQKGAGAMDTLEVCIKDATEAYVWKAVW